MADEHTDPSGPPTGPAGEARESAAEARERLCRDGWPPALALAAVEPGDYAAYVGGLGVLRFERAADLGNGWVGLYPAVGGAADWRETAPFAFPAGIEVRAEDVRWVARDPDG